MGRGLKVLAVALVIISAGMLLAEAEAPDFVKQGDYHLLRGEYELAKRLYDQAIARDPSNAKAYLNRAYTYLGLGQEEQWQRDILAAIENDSEITTEYSDPLYLRPAASGAKILHPERAPDFDEFSERFFNDQAKIAFQENRYGLAIEIYDISIELYPDFGEHYYNRAKAFYLVGEHEKALEDYEKGANKDPGFMKEGYIDFIKRFPEPHERDRANVWDEITGMLSENVEDGAYELYYGSGQLKEKGTLQNGQLEGENKTFYENGRKRSEGTYEDGKLEGVFRMYYENGQLAREVTYENGILEGPARGFLPTGELREQGFYSEGERVR